MQQRWRPRGYWMYKYLQETGNIYLEGNHKLENWVRGAYRVMRTEMYGGVERKICEQATMRVTVYRSLGSYIDKVMN
jgi:hypothetical protein